MFPLAHQCSCVQCHCITNTPPKWPCMSPSIWPSCMCNTADIHQYLLAGVGLWRTLMLLIQGQLRQSGVNQRFIKEAHDWLTDGPRPVAWPLRIPLLRSVRAKANSVPQGLLLFLVDDYVYITGLRGNNSSIDHWCTMTERSGKALGLERHCVVCQRG